MTYYLPPQPKKLSDRKRFSSYQRDRQKRPVNQVRKGTELHAMTFVKVKADLLTPAQHLIAKQRWKKALDAVRSNVRQDNASVPLLGLSETAYHLEKLDPQHRRGKNLIEEFNIWKKSNTTQNFFDWLNTKEERTGKLLPRMVYRVSDEEREKIHAQWRDGLLFLDGKPCDTTEYKGKIPGFAAYSLSANNQLFLAEHQARRDVHASLQGGNRVSATGMIKVKQGKIAVLTNFSGHYHPGLKNLVYAVKNIPADCFLADSKIVFQELKFPRLTKWLRESKYRFLREIGGKVSKQFIELTMSRKEFISFAEKKLEKDNNKFIYKRDTKNNRYENTLFESHLAKAILDNDETWRPLILKINQWIYDIIKDNQQNKKMVSLIVDSLKEHTGLSVNKKNFLTIAEQFLLKSNNWVNLILFHGIFFEKIYPKIDKEGAYYNLAAYKKIRTDDLFAPENRGPTVSLKRGLDKCKHPFYRSSAWGIMPDVETPAELSHYFENQPGEHRPSKYFYKLKGERLSYEEAQKNRDSKHQAITFREEMIGRDISFISGASGTTTKIIAPLKEKMNLTDIELKEYLMVRGAVLTACGHHSMYECMILARKLEFSIEYNHGFYHNQFITPAVRESKPYKEFLDSYSSVAEAHIPKLSENETRMHQTYVNVQRAMGIKKISNASTNEKTFMSRFSFLTKRDTPYSVPEYEDKGHINRPS